VSNSLLEDAAQLLTIAPEWNRAIMELDDAVFRNNTTVCVTGPKSSGKSTFCRLLANRWITRPQPASTSRQTKVVFLDIDPGQAEYSPPGVISLLELREPNLSPSFCHPTVARGSRNKVLRCHALAAITPSQDPDHYTACALDLLAEYHRVFRGRCPLIINTPGWIQGSGLDLLCELIRRIRPSKVFYMSQDGPIETVEGLTDACGTAGCTILPSQPSEYMARTALQLRTMQTLSYFHVRPDTSEQAYLQWDFRPLTEIAPWIVPYSGANCGFLGLVFYDSNPAPDLVAEAINGTVLAIVNIEDAAALGTQASAIETSDSRGMDVDALRQGLPGDLDEGIPLLRMKDGVTLDPKHSHFMCLVLVRGVDTIHRTLHLLSPISEPVVKELQEQAASLVLVAGNFETPTWAYAEDLYKRSWSSGAQVTETAVFERDSSDEEQSFAAVPAESSKAQTAVEESDRPWVEVLHGNQKRVVGSRAWRVRRDLGRSAGGTG
jgi:polynucleotide 5'-hydroxyl-kinase GRC3/NOL9